MPRTKQEVNSNVMQQCTALYQFYVAEIFILAGVNEGLEVVIFSNGLWEFSDE